MLALASEIQAYLGLSASNASQVAMCNLCTLLAPMADRLVKKYLGSAIEQASFTMFWPLISSKPSLSQGITEDEAILQYEGSPQGARPIRQGRGNSRDTLPLLNIPVRSVTSVYENPTAWLNPAIPTGDFFSMPQYLLKQGTDYAMDWDSLDASGADISLSGFLFRIGGIWGLTARSVRVTYVGGYTAEELATSFTEFKMATIMTGAWLVKQAQIMGLGISATNSGIVLGEKLDDYAINYMPLFKPLELYATDLPVSAKMALESSRNMWQFL